MTDKIIQALIVDDEPIAREYIRDLLKDEKTIEIAGEACNGLEALEAAIHRKPDLIFLDIQMPGMDGFEVLEHLLPDLQPHIIFVTAYDKYALKAFEVSAIDYLLKPFEKKRFSKALEKAKDIILSGKDRDLQKRMHALIKDLKQEKKHLKRLLVKSRGRIYFLRADDIQHIEAAGNYVSLYAAGTEHLIRNTLNSIEKQLDPEKFVRIHRSTIVNIEFIRELQPQSSGEYILLMADGQRLTLSRTYKNNLLDQL
jgi:two-component system LytT family response regulator